MSCNLKTIKENSISQARDIFIGNSTTFKKVKEDEVWMPVSSKFSKAQLFRILESNSKRVAEWATEKFKSSKFSKDWLAYNEKTDGYEVLITFPNNLEEAYKIKIEREEKNKLVQERVNTKIKESNTIVENGEVKIPDDLLSLSDELSEKEILERLKYCK